MSDKEKLSKLINDITKRKEGCNMVNFDKTIEEEIEALDRAMRRGAKAFPTIVCLIGATGSGKDTLLSAIAKEYPNTFKPLVSHTSRPRRECEVEGREYHFISEEEFIDKLGAGEFVEYRKYKVATNETWYYGLHDTEVDLESDNIYIGIFDINGYNEIVREYGSVNVFPVYVDCDAVTRLERVLGREDIKVGSEKYREVLRRFYADSCDIECHRDSFRTIFFNNNTTAEEFTGRVQCLSSVIVDYHHYK